MKIPIEWLLDASPPWVQYHTRLDLLHQSETDPEVIAARAAIGEHPLVHELLSGLSSWSVTPIKRHNNAAHPLHKLTFLAELGLYASYPAIQTTLEQIMSHQSKEGPFQILVNIPTHFGGSGHDEWQWMLCDAPSILYALLKFGLEEDSRTQPAVERLAGLVCEYGWPCAAAPELGKFRGPGHKDDPCPYATLIMLKALAQSTSWRDSEACRIGAETLLELWSERKRRKPYLFGMGTDFVKLKAPLIWYDILHVLDVLSQFPWLHPDVRLREMAAIVAAKADDQGRFTPESVWLSWKGWDFGQKREPSHWLTLITTRALHRLQI